LSAHKKGASKGVKRPPYRCSQKGRKGYIVNVEREPGVTELIASQLRGEG